MNHSVTEFGQLGVVPSVSRTDKITGNTLQTVDVVTVAYRTFLEVLLCILISTVHAAVSVMVNGAVADIIFVD